MRIPQVCCCSVPKSCPTLCNPMDCSRPGFLSFTISQFAQTHVNYVQYLRQCVALSKHFMSSSYYYFYDYYSFPWLTEWRTNIQTRELSSECYHFHLGITKSISKSCSGFWSLHFKVKQNLVSVKARMSCMAVFS